MLSDQEAKIKCYEQRLAELGHPVHDHDED